MGQKEELQSLIADLQTELYDLRRGKDLIGAIQEQQTKALQPVLEAMAITISNSIRAAVKDAINITVPEPKVTVNVPEGKSPIVNVPQPHVVVNVPEAKTPIVNIPKQEIHFPDEMYLKYDSKRPLAVRMFDVGGKPMQFPSMSMGASGGKADFFTILGITNTVGVVTINPDGQPVYSSSSSSGGGSTQMVDSSNQTYTQANPFPVVVVSGGSATTASALVDSSGVQYSGSNPFPTTASVSISLPFGPGDQATATRFTQAGDSVGSTNILQINGNTPATGLNETTAGVLRVVTMSDTVSSVYANNPVAQGDSATALRVVHAGDVSVSTNVVAFNGNAPATGLNETTVGVLRTVTMSDTVNSVNVTTFNGNAPATGLNETTVGALRTVLMTDSNSSVNVTQFNGNAPATGLNETTVGVLRTVQMTDSTNSVNVTQFNGVTPATGLNETTNGVLRTITMSDTASSSQSKLIAMTTLPTAVANGSSQFQKSDKLGREINRPINARDLISTAYTTTTTGVETTLATAGAGQFFDLISVLIANTSTVAVQVDIRAVSGGNIVQTIEVPASASSGWTPPVPWPQDATGNLWTIKNPGTDVSGTTLAVSALFSIEN